MNLCMAVTSAGRSILIIASTFLGPVSSAHSLSLHSRWMKLHCTWTGSSSCSAWYFLLCNDRGGSSDFGGGEGQPFHQCPPAQWWADHPISYTHLSVPQHIDQSVVSHTQVLGRCHTTGKAIGAFPKGSEMFWAYLTLHSVLSGEIHPSGQLLWILMLWISLAKYPPLQGVGRFSFSMRGLGAVDQCRLRHFHLAFESQPCWIPIL